ncbi:olfactory receptor 4C12-like [Tachyglossus aculeatus]|uniref:olfactory receptor 4C12-like n=1 Tax=Tachyglossus aculeatus TaxID=9261 RepID=UPI0018F35574|nr:olfactory receptor 4C12-like [Tachyglossus aculeatus]
MVICKPLHYTTIMSRHLCSSLLALAWARGFLHATIHTLFMTHLPFCGPSVIDHFMCDLYPLLKLFCSDTHTLSVLVAANSSGMCMLIFILLMIFYAFILPSLKTHSAVGYLPPYTQTRISNSDTYLNTDPKFFTSLNDAKVEKEVENIIKTIKASF